MATERQKVSVITGAAGFIGSHLSDYLLAQGHRVIGLDNLNTGTLRNLEHIDTDDFVYMNMDITGYIDIPGEVDYIYHLACPASPIDYLQIPLHTLKVGAVGTRNALGLAKAKRARFLITSTSEVYGDPEVHPQTEDYWGNVNPIGPRSVYDEAKRYAETTTMAYHRQQGLDTRIVRLFNTYGPRMRPYDGRAVPTFIRQALEDKHLTVFGDGSQTRSFCYVSELVEGIVGIMNSDYHGPVNLGNPGEYTIKQLAEMIIEMTGSNSKVVYQVLPTDDPKRRRPDITLVKKLTGWEPTIPVDDGLSQTVDWFKKYFEEEGTF
ncbi:MAG: SDR family oxidoreductase [Thermoleophilia bacterium]|nr:SDR family oxidoreductase [Thermoleophilia bacterium]